MNSYRFAGTRVDTGEHVADQVSADCDEAARALLIEQGIVCDKTHRVDPCPTRFQWRVFGWAAAIVAASASIAVCVLVANEEIKWYRFKSQRDAQFAAILQLGDFPPPGRTENEWRNGLILLYNVWGNTVDRPGVLNADEMDDLTDRLNEVVSRTTNNNSVQSVDLVFEILLDTGLNHEFVARHRKSFRGPFEIVGHAPLDRRN
jgi:hypothetical protein